MMSDGHSTARSLSLIECLNEWITHPSGTLAFSHLFIAAEAELALLVEARLYLGNRKPLPDAPSIALEAAHRASPTNGTHLSLPLVLSLRHGCGVIFIWAFHHSNEHHLLTIQRLLQVSCQCHLAKLKATAYHRPYDGNQTG